MYCISQPSVTNAGENHLINRGGFGVHTVFDPVALCQWLGCKYSEFIGEEKEGGGGGGGEA